MLFTPRTPKTIREQEDIIASQIESQMRLAAQQEFRERIRREAEERKREELKEREERRRQAEIRRREVVERLRKKKEEEERRIQEAENAKLRLEKVYNPLQIESPKEFHIYL